ncbi:hypothetical protein [Microbacterium paraoxydans]|uniref:Uncharacterized protein n=1 Tax=Microbacterium paraoxydans TaxID=199592 RepID=A0ABS5IP57_9MICO|nr:hypothetical protein [Microbacterium paraoxydans]MBS0024705.1 hypothetical protein [Microbacterium paraoxydans]
MSMRRVAPILLAIAGATAVQMASIFLTWLGWFGGGPLLSSPADILNRIGFGLPVIVVLSSATCIPMIFIARSRRGSRSAVVVAAIFAFVQAVLYSLLLFWHPFPPYPGLTLFLLVGLFAVNFLVIRMAREVANGPPDTSDAASPAD